MCDDDSNYWHEDDRVWLNREEWDASVDDALSQLAEDDESSFSLGPEEEPCDVWIYDGWHAAPRARLKPEDLYEQGYVWIHNTWFETDAATFVGFRLENVKRRVR